MFFIKPLVSIIIPAYNAEKTIQRAIISCLNQTYVNIEVIVIDNQSVDRTAEIVKSNQDSRINYIYSARKGRSLARNIGLQKASGSFIQFLDADDELSLNKIEKGIIYLVENPIVKAHISGVNYIKNGQEVLELMPQLHYPSELLAHNILPIHAVLFRKTKTITFDESIEYCEDWLYWVEELYGEKLYFDTGYIGATVHIHEDNTMGHKDRMNEYQLFVQQKIKERYPLVNRQLWLNELKLLVIHYFTNEKEPLTIEIIKRNNRWFYGVISVILVLPVVRQIARRRVGNLTQKNMY